LVYIVFGLHSQSIFICREQHNDEKEQPRLDNEATISTKSLIYLYRRKDKDNY